MNRPFPSAHRRWCLAAGAALLYGLGAVAPAVAAPITLGWLEWAWIEPDHIRLKAKLDTGARTSSIDAVDVEEFEREGEPWVRFRVPLSERDDERTHAEDVIFERPVARETRIKTHTGKVRKRYVVELDLCLAGRTFTTPVSLSDRGNFLYPLLVGRLALKNRIVVDAAHTYTGERRCRKPAAD